MKDEKLREILQEFMVLTERKRLTNHFGKAPRAHSEKGQYNRALNESMELLQDLYEKHRAFDYER